jgi:hypothetical protein
MRDQERRIDQVNLVFGNRQRCHKLFTDGARIQFRSETPHLFGLLFESICLFQQGPPPGVGIPSKRFQYVRDLFEIN